MKRVAALTKEDIIALHKYAQWFKRCAKLEAVYQAAKVVADTFEGYRDYSTLKALFKAVREVEP